MLHVATAWQPAPDTCGPRVRRGPGRLHLPGQVAPLPPRLVRVFHPPAVDDRRLLNRGAHGRVRRPLLRPLGFSKPQRSPATCLFWHGGGLAWDLPQYLHTVTGSSPDALPCALARGTWTALSRAPWAVGQTGSFGWASGNLYALRGDETADLAIYQRPFVPTALVSARHPP